ncbi:MAG: chemotaxis protein CheW [Bacillota bacterium]|nr:chemotaxis protein CheW [Bacillota bacterium]
MSEILAEIVQNEEDTQHGKFLTFALGEEVYGIEIKFVTEVVVMQKISDIPESPNYVKGIINLRGKIIPVIDMRLKLKKDSTQYTGRTCIVVIDIQALIFGLIVDNVDEVIMIPDTSIVPPPSYKTGFQNRYIKGIGKVNEEVRLLIDCECFFKNDELQAVSQTSESHMTSCQISF